MSVLKRIETARDVVLTLDDRKSFVYIKAEKPENNAILLYFICSL